LISIHARTGSGRDFHARAFSPGRWQIITVGGADIVMLDAEYRPAEISLACIEIRPDHQGGGIGTCLISALIDEADQKVRDLVLDVLTVNRRARRPGSRPLIPPRPGRSRWSACSPRHRSRMRQAWGC